MNRLKPVFFSDKNFIISFFTILLNSLLILSMSTSPLLGDTVTWYVKKNTWQETLHTSLDNLINLKTPMAFGEISNVWPLVKHDFNDPNSLLQIDWVYKDGIYGVRLG